MEIEGDSCSLRFITIVIYFSLAIDIKGKFIIYLIRPISYLLITVMGVNECPRTFKDTMIVIWYLRVLFVPLIFSTVLATWVYYAEMINKKSENEEEDVDQGD